MKSFTRLSDNESNAKKLDLGNYLDLSPGVVSGFSNRGYGMMTPENNYLDLSPDVVGGVSNIGYGMISPNRKPPKPTRKAPTPIAKQTTPPTVRKFKKTPLLSRHKKIDTVIMKKKSKLVQTTLEGKKTDAKPPKRGYTKKGKDKKPSKQGKLKAGCRRVKFTACN